MNLNGIYDIISNYASMLDKVYVKPYIFIHFTLILICVSIIRYIILIKFQSSKSKIKKISNADTIYIFGHVLFELLISFIICYFIIKLTFANPHSYIINYILGPAVGFLFAVFIDNKILIRTENSNGGSMLNNVRGNVDAKSFKKSKSSNDITININENNNKEESFPYNKNNNISKGSLANHINENDINDENFDQLIMNSINAIIDTQSIHSEQISTNSDTLNNIADVVNILRESEMNDKKIELKYMMYKCLNNGYATPEENDKITTYYKSYRSLHGNGEVESLYEEHYIKLPIHNN